MSVTAPSGFVAAGVACGIKASGDLDLALVATADGHPVPAAAVFTANRATAAPVQVSRAHLEVGGGQACAVVLNSGNANAATGEPGREDAERTCALVADELGCRAHNVLVCSTGLIGIPLPMEPLLAGIPVVARSLRAEGGVDAAAAILTTDTVRKEVVVDGGGFTVGGMAKGAAMLAPDMATMLAVLTTDAAAPEEGLVELLRAAVDRSFNALSIDGCTSTNDTVILLAGGAAGPVDPDALAAAVAEACTSLAAQMAGDAEGATKVVTIEVVGAASDEEASRAARRVAESQLCKCSWYGEDPYWGRILSEVGSAGVEFDPDRASVSYGGVTSCRRGVAAAHDANALAAVMAEREITIVVDLGLGEGRGRILTNDLTHAYVDENMGTS
ncbi:MAG TPA: bifunctional glutamate N-acetyltransferase/amino-acid acetyltransferase ArgJ [Acidimicrobiales bacterium]|nr:bifunctional glutamate N-acetyltransferase/amino-acid acetyltransferase ArgJ [Acidimicrobiales bacterium]